jgi:hypothetical protein
MLGAMGTVGRMGRSGRASAVWQGALPCVLMGYLIALAAWLP